MGRLEIFSDIIKGHEKSLILNQPNQREVPEPPLQSETPWCDNTSANLRGFNRLQEHKMLLGQQPQTPHGASGQRREAASGIKPSPLTLGAGTGGGKHQRDLLLPSISKAIKLAFSQPPQSCIKQI